MRARVGPFATPHIQYRYVYVYMYKCTHTSTHIHCMVRARWTMVHIIMHGAWGFVHRAHKTGAVRWLEHDARYLRCIQKHSFAVFTFFHKTKKFLLVRRSTY
eukprot:COSAG05_NODE_173_length_14969_cov_29.555884_9_plen_102_part_00